MTPMERLEFLEIIKCTLQVIGIIVLIYIGVKLHKIEHKNKPWR